MDAYSPKWDHQQKLIITIAALCASLSSPRRFVDAHVSRDLFDYDLDATPLEERAPDLAKKLEQIDLAYESDESEHLDKPVDKTSSPKTDRTGMLSNEDEAAVAAEMKQVEKEELTETARERARRNRAQRWLKAICRSFDVDFRSLPPDPRVGEARVLGEEIPASMYHEILHDLILFSLSVDDSDGSAPANSDQAKKVRQGEAEEAKQAQSAITFSALDRKLVFVTADILGITREQVYLSEKVVAQEVRRCPSFFICPVSDASFVAILRHARPGGPEEKLDHRGIHERHLTVLDRRRRQSLQDASMGRCRGWSRPRRSGDRSHWRPGCTSARTSARRSFGWRARFSRHERGRRLARNALRDRRWWSCGVPRAETLKGRRRVRVRSGAASRGGGGEGRRRGDWHTQDSESSRKRPF